MARRMFFCFSSAKGSQREIKAGVPGGDLISGAEPVAAHRETDHVPCRKLGGLAVDFVVQTAVGD